MSYDLFLVVHEPTNARQVYDMARRVIGIPEGHATSTTFHEDMDRAIGWDESHPSFGFADGRRYFRSEPGGYACALTLFYGADGPLGDSERFVPEDGHEHDLECNGWSSMSLHMSTGASAADMLTYFVREIGMELTAMGRSWAWIDPQTGRSGPGAELSRAEIEAGRALHDEYLSEREEIQR